MKRKDPADVIPETEDIPAENAPDTEEPFAEEAPVTEDAAPEETEDIFAAEDAAAVTPSAEEGPEEAVCEETVETEDPVEKPETEKTVGLTPEEIEEEAFRADLAATAPLEELPGAGFEETVENARTDKIVSSFRGKKKRVLNSAFFVRLALLALCGALFMYSAVSIAQRLADDMKSEQFIEDLRNDTSEKPAMSRLKKSRSVSSPLCLYDALGVSEYNPEYTEPEISDEYDPILNTLEKLRAVNKDIYGWIRCTGGMLGIDYPVVKADDNDYYLRRNLYGEYSVAGTIFVDYRDNARHGESYNTVIYGHNMTNGTMFRAVKDWFDSAERNATAPLINVEIITLHGAYIYEIFSAYRSDGAEFITVSFRSNSSYKSFLKSILRKSVLNQKFAYDENTRILTLCTCTNSGRNEDERYVVHCRLVKIINYN